MKYELCQKQYASFLNTLTDNRQITRTANSPNPAIGNLAIAGAYGIQEWIGYVGIEKIEGSFCNVMRLPVQMLYNELIDFIENQ